MSETPIDSRPWLDGMDSKETPTGREKDIDVNLELEALIDEAVEHARTRQREQEQGRGEDVSNEIPEYLSARVGTMLEVLHGDDIVGGRSLADVIEERTSLIAEEVTRIKESHGPLRGSRFVEPEWDALVDAPIGVGYHEPGEQYPGNIADKLATLEAQKDALTTLGDLAAEVDAIRAGEHPTWNKPGDIDNGARIGFIGQISRGRA